MPTHEQKDNPAQLQAQTGTGQGQLPEAPFPLEVAADAPVRIQLDFVQSAFANIQELNRMLDQKANYLLAAVALLTAALGIVVSGAITIATREDWQRALKGAGVLLILLYLLLAFAVIFVATSIYQARSHRVSAATGAPGMLFPLMLLRRYSVADKVNETAYLDRLRTLQPDDILQDYSNQIIEVSIIYEAKQKQLNLGLRLFKWMGILWLVTMLVVVMIIVVLQ
jgi:type IV secretory pathway VirB2 component (pilin)